MRDRIALVLRAKNRPCADCGNTFHPVAMDFDHVRGEKYSEISTMLRQSASIERIQAEIDKCEVVCAVCHRIRTHLRKAANGAPPYSIYLGDS